MVTLTESDSHSVGGRSDSPARGYSVELAGVDLEALFGARRRVCRIGLNGPDSVASMFWLTQLVAESSLHSSSASVIADCSDALQQGDGKELLNSDIESYWATVVPQLSVNSQAVGRPPCCPLSVHF
jgi:hypothetical protein